MTVFKNTTRGGPLVAAVQPPLHFCQRTVAAAIAAASKCLSDSLSQSAGHRRQRVWQSPVSWLPLTTWCLCASESGLIQLLLWPPHMKHNEVHGIT